MFNKKVKAQANRTAICSMCGLECLDKDSLDRHVDWAHREQQAAAKV